MKRADIDEGIEPGTTTADQCRIPNLEQAVRSCAGQTIWKLASSLMWTPRLCGTGGDALVAAASCWVSRLAGFGSRLHIVVNWEIRLPNLFFLVLRAWF